MKSLTRDEFREAVFARDNHKCVMCSKPAQDAHHIIERRLFQDGGYVLNNGASLCGDCHIDAESTDISPDDIRKAAGITHKILPDHLYGDYEYTKWGDIMLTNGTRLKGELYYDESVQKILGNRTSLYSAYVKYPRTYHLPCSYGRTKDDRVLKDYSMFEGREVVATIKMDGENTSGNSDGHIHARSLDSNNHESRNWVKQYLTAKCYDLPKGWRMCGENLYAKHSIKYTCLKSYFYLFSIWNEKNECLSYHETTEWANLLDLQMPPVMYYGIFNKDVIENLYQNTWDGNECEGFVLRNTNAFSYGSFRINVGKFVRSNHVQTNQHWIKQKMVPNEL